MKLFRNLNLAIAFIALAANTIFAQEKLEVSIYQIQYTTNPGGGTYPSPYEGQVVTTGGIVTGANYNNGRFFIGSSQGGAWNGLYVYNNYYNVSVGDSVIIEAEVMEYNGITELTSLISLNIINSGNPLPTATPITTFQAISDEAYEGVLVEVNNVEVTQEYDEYYRWMVDDGTGSCFITTGFYSMSAQGAPILMGYPFEKITGILSYFYGNYLLEPRGVDDFISAENAFVISNQEETFYNSEFEIPIEITFWGEEQQVNSYSFQMQIDTNIINYEGYNLTSTLSQGGNVTVSQPNAETVNFEFNGNFSFVNMQNLLKLQFSVVSEGNTTLSFNSFYVDGTNILYFSLGDIYTFDNSLPIGDTLTVIQKPILNIPVIVVPGEEFEIECVADPAVSGWSAYVLHEDKELPVSINSSFYDANIDRWILTAVAPNPEIFELYDLKVSATGIETDITKNAVQIIPQRKTNYTIVHITDTHLPTHIFYPDPGYLTDTSEMQDFREVINDINLINPEFVLFTGDIINEGEMEDFENRRVYTKAQRILTEFEVPVFLTVGNHDVGGWVDSPPPQGTARRDWWRFFGWKWLQNPPAADPYYTQNYSFDYGQIHYTALEAYDNYDSYMFPIYGETSFTDGQMEWLENDLSNSNGEKNIAFYHYDFQDQIDIETMGIDLALWGHTHSNWEDYTPPYSISSAAVCDGNRAYRIINIEGTTINPMAAIYAGYNGQNLQVSYAPSNIGEEENVTATIQNQQPQSFDNARVKFIMPSGNYEYTVTNGTIEQVDESGAFSVVYVLTNVDANSTKIVSINGVEGIEEDANEGTGEIRIKPNPFSNEVEIEFNVEEKSVVEVSFYTINGKKIIDFVNQEMEAGKHSMKWNAANQWGEQVEPGVYFCKCKIGSKQFTEKLIYVGLNQ